MKGRDYTNSSIENLELFFLMGEAYRLGMIKEGDYKAYIKECLEVLVDEGGTNG